MRLRGQSGDRAASRTRDSLKKVLRDCHSSLPRLEVLHELARVSRSDSMPLAISYYEEAIELAHRSGHDKKRGQLHFELGNLYLGANELSQASASYRQAIEIQRAQHDSLGLANSYNNLGVALRWESNFHEAFIYYLRSLRLYSDLDHSLGQARAHNNLAIIFNQYADNDKAIEHFSRCADAYRRAGDAQSVADALNNLGAIYVDMPSPREGLASLYEAKRLYDSLENPLGLAIVNNNIGLVLGKEGQHAKAAEYHRAAVGYYAQNPNLEMRLCIAMGNLAAALRAQDSLEAALPAARKAMQLADSLGSPELKALTAEELASSLALSGRHKEANHYYTIALENLKEESKIKGKEYLNDLEARELERGSVFSEQSRMSQRMKMRLGTLVGVLLLAGAGVAVSIWCRRKRKNGQEGARGEGQE